RSAIVARPWDSCASPPCPGRAPSPFRARPPSKATLRNPHVSRASLCAKSRRRFPMIDKLEDEAVAHVASPDDRVQVDARGVVVPATLDTGPATARQAVEHQWPRAAFFPRPWGPHIPL